MNTGERFDKLLKAMVKGEPPKQKTNAPTSSDKTRSESEKPSSRPPA